MGAVYGKRLPEVFRHVSGKISVDLSRAVRRAGLDTEAFKFIEFLIRVTNLPTVEVDHAERTVPPVHQISRMEIPVQVYRRLRPYRVDILPHESDGAFVAGYPHVRRLVAFELAELPFLFCLLRHIRRVQRQQMDPAQDAARLASETVLLFLRQRGQNLFQIVALDPREQHIRPRSAPPEPYRLGYRKTER